MEMRATGSRAGRDDPSIGEGRRTGPPVRTIGDRAATLNAAYADLLRRTERLERSNADLEALGGELAHDLSEGVATIAFFAEALESTLGPDLDEAARHDLDGIRAGVKRAQSLISATLRAAERDGGPERGGPVDTNAVLRDALANLKARREEAGARISAEPLPAVSGHAPELTRLFQNLLANALRFRDPSRPPRIRIGAWRMGRRWRFEIADNGVGIDAGERAAGPEGPEASAEHPGFGLRLCRRIVEAHGGQLRLAPSPGEPGTIASFDLPAVEPSGRRFQR
jgi:light-regulated signal transduction histidine kinase (bacteriophytochrome)